MKISRLLGLIFAVPAVAFLYLSVKVDAHYRWYMIPFVFLLVGVYLFSPQIEWWWARRYPPKTDPNVIKFLNKYFDFFQNLSGEEKDKFLRRLHLFMMAREFIPKVGDEVPTPIKVMIAAQAVKMTFGLGDEEFLLKDYDRIVLYPHPFPSPQHRQLHHSETHHEDGVLIFATPPVINQFHGRGHIFNLVLYEWVTAFRQIHSGTPFPGFEESVWDVFTEEFLVPKKLVEASTGVKGPDVRSVAAALYLDHKDRFTKLFPEQAGAFKKIFRQ